MCIVRIYRDTKMKYKVSTYFSREGVSLDAVLGTLLVFHPIVDVYLLELIAISQGSAGDIYVLFGVLVYPKDKGLACVVQKTAHLQKELFANKNVILNNCILFIGIIIPR